MEKNENMLRQDEENFLERFKDEIQPILSKEEAGLLEHLYEGVLTQEQIEKILEEQETKIYTWDRPSAGANAKKALLVGRDPGTAVGIQGLLREMKGNERIGSLGVLIDGVAQNFLSKDLEDFKKIDESPLIIADIMKSAEKPYDIIINTGSATNNPASVTMENADLLTQGRPGAKKYFVYEGYEFAVEQEYYRQIENMDGVFCNDELAKAVLEYKLPKLDPDKIHTTGTGQIDALKLDQAEEFMHTGRTKLDIPEDAFVVAYLGTISSAYAMYDMDPEVNEKSWRRTVETMVELSQSNPEKQYVLLYRYHPRDPKREELFDETQTLALPENLRITKATADANISIDETVYASNVLASITITENLKAHHRKRQGIYLGYDEPGMGLDYLKKNYTLEIIAAMEEKAKLKIIKNDSDLLTFLKSIDDEPLVNPLASAHATSSRKMLDIILSEQQK